MKLQSPESRGRRGFWITEVTGKDAEPARCSRVTLPWDWLRLSIKKGDKVDRRSCRSSAQSQGHGGHRVQGTAFSLLILNACSDVRSRDRLLPAGPPKTASLRQAATEPQPLTLPPRVPSLSATRGVGDFPRGRKDAAVTPVGAAGGTFPSAFPALDKARQGQFALHSQHPLRQNRTGPDVSARVTCKAYAPPGRGGP